MRRAGLIASGVVGVLVLAGLGAWLALLRDTAEPPLEPPGRSAGEAGERVLLQTLADRWTDTLRTHAEHWAAVYPMGWREPE